MACSRQYGFSRIATTPPNLFQTTSHAAKNSISSQCFLPWETLKRRRSRRGRIRECYAKAIAAFSTVYPKIFSGCPVVKIEPGGPTEEPELLQELPPLISTLKQSDYEVPVLLPKSPDEFDSPSPGVPTWNSAVATWNSDRKPQANEAPGFDPQTEDSCVVESLLDSNNGEDGLEGILGGSGDSNSVPDVAPSPAGVFGDHMADEGAFYSAARALRRRQWHRECCPGDDVASGHVAPRGMRLADKIRAEEKMNAMSFCSLDWLKRDDQLGLALKLNYDEILSAWSDRGSLYIDKQCPQTVPGDDEDDDDGDDVDSAMARVDVGLVPDLNFWRVEDENVIQCNNHTAEDGCSSASAVEGGMKTGIREARVLRYKEKRQTRLFSKKIRYQVRKINAERRPRMKGRFVKRLADL